MPELTLTRRGETPPMVCMYCGAPATATREWDEVNRRPGGGGGADATPVPPGDDPVSAVIGLLLLPLVLWDLLKALVAAVGWALRPRATVPPRPAAPLPTTRVVVTTCARHERFGDRFVWAGAATAVGVAALWGWAVVEARRAAGTDDTGLAVALVLAAVLATVLAPTAIAAWYALAGPVVVDRVTEDAVVLDRVRRAYFAAAGRAPDDDRRATEAA